MNLEKLKYRLHHLTLTDGIIIANVLMFILSNLIDLTGKNGLFLLGSKVNVLIAFGEYWRLLTSMFLHADVLHILFNMLMLNFLGRDIERFYGKWKFLAIYLVGGLIGSGASYVFTSGNSVGASGAIFALLGANLYLYKLNPKLYKSIYGTDLIALTAFNIVLGVVRPNIDMAGHIGGLIGGFFLAFALGLSYEKWFSTKRLLPLLISVTLLSSLFVYGTYQVKQDQENHLAAIYYYKSIGNDTKAQSLYDKAIERFNLNP